MTSGELSRKQPWTLGPQQAWTVEQVNAQHVEALYLFGEPCLFTMMWRAQDFEAGLVGHCQTCYGRSGRAFKQSDDSHCPDCYGTTFEGGVRAQVLRPAIWADRDIERVDTSRGTVDIDQPLLETTGDFDLLKGDYVFRSDGSRYQTEEKGEAHVRTGHGNARVSDSFRGTIPAAHLEDPTSVAYLIPPTTDDLLSLLDGTTTSADAPLGVGPLPDRPAPGGVDQAQDFTFVDQGSWVVPHDLGVLVPGTVVVTDLDGRSMLARVDYATVDRLVVRWPAPTSGRVVVKP